MTNDAIGNDDVRSMTGEETAAEWAAEKIAQVRGDPSARMALLTHTYRGAVGATLRLGPFGRAAVSFMRWQAQRGVLRPVDGTPAGSGWWRAVNERLLLDGCEAMALAAGMEGDPSSPTVRLWMSFIATPTPRTWYRAHNFSIVSAYLKNGTWPSLSPGPNGSSSTSSCYDCSSHTLWLPRLASLSDDPESWRHFSEIRGSGRQGRSSPFAVCFRIATRSMAKWRRISQPRTRSDA